MGDFESEAWLPDEVMYLIMSKLMVLPIYLARFSAVCKRWRQLVSDAWPELIHQHQPTPIALVPVVKEEGKLVEIYTLRGEYVNSLPRDFTRIIGSSFGWLILTNITNSSVSLFNPLSKSHIRLPPFTPQNPYDFPQNPHYLVKGVLSKPPPRPEQEDAHFDIAITMSPTYLKSCKAATEMAFLHVGNYKAGELESMQWVYRRNSKILDVNSIGGRICILDADSGSISCCKCSRDRFSDYCVTKSLPSWIFDIGRHHFATTVYILESSSSEPVVVFRYKDHTCSGWPTVGFKILTLTSTSGGDNEMNKTWNWTEDKVDAARGLHLLKWTKIETLDNDVLLLSDKASICIQDAYKLHTSDSFYIPDEFEYDPRGIGFGVFNVDLNGVKQFSFRPDVTEFRPRPPIWLQVPSYDEILKFPSIG